MNQGTKINKKVNVKVLVYFCIFKPKSGFIDCWMLFSLDYANISLKKKAAMCPRTGDFFNEQVEGVLDTFPLSQLHMLRRDHWLQVSDGSTAFDNQRWVCLQQGCCRKAHPGGGNRAILSPLCFS